jgi:cyclophilin family peptidyl-prolyl cis-trans isomerase
MLVAMLITLLALQAAAVAPATAPKAPSEIVAAAPAADWIDIAPDDLLVMQLAPGASGKERRVVIQLMPPPFSQPWIANIRTLAKAHWWDGTSVNRVQDNYVVQWGDATEKRSLPTGMQKSLEADYIATVPDKWRAEWSARVDTSLKAVEGLALDDPDASLDDANSLWKIFRDPYALVVDHRLGWPIAATEKSMWPVHCYGMIGVGRNLSPDAGSGAELYTVIGHAPRHLDRNIAVVGRVVEGIEHLSSLPRGTGALGFYEDPKQRVPIASIRLASELPEAERPRMQYLSTESTTFAAYADARANRKDAFFNVPAGGADICNVPVPIRRKF